MGFLLVFAWHFYTQKFNSKTFLFRLLLSQQSLSRIFHFLLDNVVLLWRNRRHSKLFKAAKVSSFNMGVWESVNPLIMLSFFFMRMKQKNKTKNKTKQKKSNEIDLWELAEKPLTSCCICININQARENIWWVIKRALGDDVICCLLVCCAVAGWTLGYTSSPHISIEAPYSNA